MHTVVAQVGNWDYRWTALPPNRINKDLYKWSAKLLSLLDSDIVMDAFELAHTARVLDIRASPYDLRTFGYEPVCVETPPSRAECVREQNLIGKRAAVVRDTLLTGCRALLEAENQRFSPWK
jgi:hypothetical protein